MYHLGGALPIVLVNVRAGGHGAFQVFGALYSLTSLQPGTTHWPRSADHWVPAPEVVEARAFSFVTMLAADPIRHLGNPTRSWKTGDLWTENTWVLPGPSRDKDVMILQKKHSEE